MFTVYSKPDCPQCEQAKALLTLNNRQFNVVHLDVGQPKVEDEKYISRDDLLSKFPSARTMPQIDQVVDGQHEIVGGFAELKKLIG